MIRSLAALAALLGLASLARAQDMPLSQILIEGEGWKKVAGTPEKPEAAVDVAITEETGVRYSISTGRRTFWVFIPNPAKRAGKAVRVPKGSADVLTLSPDANTALVGLSEDWFLWAYQRATNDQLLNGAPYCPLRLPRGKESVAVTGLATDHDGRIYAATEIGVQVFDPTGRLCGVLTPAAKGRPEHMTFEGDHLTMWIGETKYTRKLNTMGVR